MNVVPPAENASGAVASLVLGILGLVLCPVCGPIAWSLGRNAEREVDASGGALAGRGMATAGKVLGIIGTVFLVVLVLFLIIWVVVLGLVFETFDESVTETLPR